ncbi:glycoside hydrolase family 2 [Sphingomonas sp. TDK1]|uniref:glycoside hydrolase family 2 n=1 Tax=Sphingomonas sp. TDK1 TaxID=453247 RepID=UPI0007D95CF8|nr:glycoside hydrolase family 2 [Sphingomonas sp. TDK1]OAN58591.1 hypothetical protein A7X12_05475 [Sphingomonas sp. TDK1]
MALALLGCGAVLLPIPAVAQAPARARGEAASSDPRTVLDLSQGWRFQFGAADEAPAAPGFDDAAWLPVTVPHTWNKVGAYALTRSPDANMRQGKGWYRRTITVPAALKGRRLFLEFDGVSKIADIWVNGRHVGTHAGAFGRFRLDVSDVLKPGGNSLAVRADNSASAPGSSTEHVIPLGGDFFVQGGIYRGVRLLAVDDAHIDLADHGGPGVYLHTPRISAERAEVAAKTLLRNLGTRRRALTLVTTIHDAAGKPVATDRAPVTLATGEALAVAHNLTVPAPHLWQGRDDPYLYRVVSELRDGTRVIDRQVQPLGIRSFAFDADRGFLLNGKVTPLHGVSRHQDVQGKGWALTPEDHARDMAFAIEIGANTLRHAHYQHAQEWSDEADRAGMVVWAELPFVHQANVDPSEAPAAATIANAEEQLRELIRQNVNHPSILLWSVGNEADIGAAIDAMRKGGAAKPAQSGEMLRRLDRLARTEDPSRPTVYADCCEDTPSILSMEGAPSLNGITQVMGLNRYYGWYYGDLDGIGPALDSMHARHPTLPIGLSEYGAGGAMTQHSDNALGGPVAAYGRPQPEEYQSLAIERNWKAIAQRKYLAASWLWNLFDFATTMRNEGDATDINTKGLVSYDRKTRKDAFYFLQASWSAAPVLHLNGRRYADRAYAVVDVRGYSNADRVSLSLNGKPVGEVACPDRICLWPGVALTPGANHLVATATIGGKQISDALDWTAPDPRRGVFIDSGALVGGTMGGNRYGSDNFFRGGTAKVLAGRNPFAPPPKVEGTDIPALFGSYREGRFGYEVPLPDGDWAVTIASFEPDAAKGATRSFAVLADGKRVIDALAPMQAAGGANKAVTRSFTVTSSGGRLALDFEPIGGDAVVAGIAIRSARP